MQQAVQILAKSSTPNVVSAVYQRELQLADIANELFAEMIQINGGDGAFGLKCSPILTGFGTAMVGLARIDACVAIKADPICSDILGEAEKIIAFSTDATMPTEFCAAWPQIYYVRRSPPFAYLMEAFQRQAGWLPVSDLLFSNQAQDRSSLLEGQSAISAALHLLSAGYISGIDRSSPTDPVADYVDRIASRMDAAASIDDRFASRPIAINGRIFAPWRSYLNILRDRSEHVRGIGPSFSGPIHGDANPSNILARFANQECQLKFIDPKPQMRGDYLFDATKIAHYVDVTGPIELLEARKSVRCQFVVECGVARLNYAFHKPAWVKQLTTSCKAAARRLATQQGDVAWEARYELAMAANLLGLPLTRLRRQQNHNPGNSLIFMGEGLRWLEKFCRRISYN
jgi:hypothetical protein